MYENGAFSGGGLMESNGIFLLKTAANANSGEVAMFLSSLPGVQDVLFSEGAYSFVVQARERSVQGISRKLSSNKGIESFEVLAVGPKFD